MKILFLDAQTTKENWLIEAQIVYEKKISPFFKMEIRSVLKGKNSRDQALKKKQEDSKSLMAEILSDDFVVLFDEKWKEFDSIAFSKEIQKILNSGKKRMIFLVGGSYGVNDQVFQKANLKVKLSSMTMNHGVAKVMALEQIYRALTVINHIPYHNI